MRVKAPRNRRKQLPVANNDAAAEALAKALADWFGMVVCSSRLDEGSWYLELQGPFPKLRQPPPPGEVMRDWLEDHGAVEPVLVSQYFGGLGKWGFYRLRFVAL